MLRLMVLEDRAAGPPGQQGARRFAKTGGFRKLLSGADQILIRGLMDKVMLTSSRQSSQECLVTVPPTQPPCGEPAQRTSTLDTLVDEAMKLFRRGTTLVQEHNDMNTVAGEEPLGHQPMMDNSSEGPAATELYDEMGIQVSCSALPEGVDAEELILSGNPRQRKKQALERRGSAAQPCTTPKRSCHRPGRDATPRSAKKAAKV
eukprot:8395556-Lingulodinium_polyedra.AAC.1